MWMATGMLARRSELPSVFADKLFRRADYRLKPRCFMGPASDCLAFQ
jgi:hypothetical protein